MRRLRPDSGFTLVEVMIGMTLALMVAASVLVCFVFLSRNLTRLQTQQRFEAQGRRALLYFSQDVRMATSITSVTPTASSLTLTLPTSSSTTTVTYTYTSGANATGTLARNPGFLGTSASPALLSNISSFSFSYYDRYSSPYTTLSSYLNGIKQVSLTVTLQSPASWNSTQTLFTYQVSSGRIILRNKTVLP